MRYSSIGVALVMLCGCETTVKKAVYNPDTSVTVNGKTEHQAPAGAGDLDAALGTDPSVVRLDKIIDAMLLYYHLKNDLPAKLSDLTPLTDGALELNAPSGAPYVYHHDALRTPGLSKRILVNDPAPTLTGKRWCVMLDDTPPGASLLLEVQPVPENLFLGYR